MARSIDRDVDLASALITPLTYEGLIDYAIGIESSKIKLDASILGTQETDAMAAKMAANAASARSMLADSTGTINTAALQGIIFISFLF